MTITMDDVRAGLDPDEPDYAAAAGLGPEALPFLDRLVRGADPMLAAKAAYLASLIPGEARSAVVAAAAASAEPTVRLAAAASLRNLDEAEAGRLADVLLDEADVGVRKQALRSVARFARSTATPSAAMTERVRRVAETDPEEALRDLAADELR